MSYHRIVRLAAAGALFAVAVPLAAQSATQSADQDAGTATPARVHGHAGPGHHHMLAGLNLTSDQQSKVKAIHDKYRSQLSASRAAAKPDFEAARAAQARGDTASARASFAKARATMKAGEPVRRQEMAEVRGVLTDAQRQTLDARMAQWKQSHGAGKHAKS